MRQYDNYMLVAGTTVEDHREYVRVETATGRVFVEGEETSDAERIGDAVKRWAKALVRPTEKENDGQ